jgi:ADP-ribose pyrophosphatase
LSRHLIARERLFTGNIFEVERDRLREESGLEIIRDVVRHPGGAGGLPIFADRSVALVRQYRHPAGRELLEIPAGRIEPGESPEGCARREIEAEIGVRAGRLVKLADFFSTPGFCEERLYVYLATDLAPAQQDLDPDEIVDIVRLPFDEALRMARGGEIEDAKTIIALLLSADRILAAPADLTIPTER